MDNIKSKATLSKLLQFAPHHDITRINKFIVSGCFARHSQDVLKYIKHVGYSGSLKSVSNHTTLIKQQFEIAQQKHGQEIEIDLFCDVAGTKYFDVFMDNYDKPDFYQQMMVCNPDFHFSGDLSKLKKLAFAAIKDNEFQGTGEGVSYLLDALDIALKKIGVNSEDEINGVSKSIIVASHIMDTIGGVQFYLPKGDILGKLLTDIGIYIDGFRMSNQDIARKYGVTFNTAIATSRRVSKAIKNYESGNDQP